VARALAPVQHIGMVNIALGRRAVPEFLQGGMQAARVWAGLEPLLDLAGEPARQQREAFAAFAASLGGPGAFHRTARLAAGMLDLP